MTPIARLITNLGGADPGLPASLRGASEVEIAAFEALAGQTFPPVYREFLQRMGHGMGWLRPVAARFDLESLTEHLQSTAWRPPAGLLKIALAEDDPFFDVYLEHDGQAGPRLIRMPRGPWGDDARARTAWRHPLAGSLPQFLGTAAYRTLRLSLLPHARRAYSGALAESRIGELQPLAKTLGLKASWFSNDWVAVCDGRDAAMIATQFPGGALTLDIAADSGERCSAIVDAMAGGLRVALRCN